MHRKPNKHRAVKAVITLLPLLILSFTPKPSLIGTWESARLLIGAGAAVVQDIKKEDAHYTLFRFRPGGKLMITGNQYAGGNKDRSVHYSIQGDTIRLTTKDGTITYMSILKLTDTELHLRYLPDSIVGVFRRRD